MEIASNKATDINNPSSEIRRSASTELYILMLEYRMPGKEGVFVIEVLERNFCKKLYLG